MHQFSFGQTRLGGCRIKMSFWNPVVGEFRKCTELLKFFSLIPSGVCATFSLSDCMQPSPQEIDPGQLIDTDRCNEVTSPFDDPARTRIRAPNPVVIVCALGQAREVGPVQDRTLRKVCNLLSGDSSA